MKRHPSPLPFSEFWKKPLRIAQLHWAFPPTIGGVETHLTSLLPKLVRDGHKVSLLTGAEEGLPARSRFAGVTVLRTPYMSLNYLRKHDAEMLEAEIRETLVKFLEGFKPDLVHVHNLHYFTPVHARILSGLCRSRGLPLILTAHNFWDDILFLQLSRDIPWDHIIAVSYFVKREMEGVGCDPRKITVIHHGIDTKIFRPGLDPTAVWGRYPQLRGKRIIFHPARMNLAKGNDVVIKAFQRVREQFQDAMLVLAGSRRIIDWTQNQRENVAYILNLVKYLGLKKSVLIDTFSIQEMPRLYAASRLVVYPSTAAEPFGLTMLEAMASARPIIVSNMGGMPEVIQDGINGYVIPVRDHASLAARMSQLLGDDRLREHLGDTGRAIVVDHYSKELMTRNHEGVYYRVLRGETVDLEDKVKTAARVRPHAAIVLPAKPDLQPVGTP